MRKKKIKKEASSAIAVMARAHKNLPPKRHESGTDTCLIFDGMNIAYMAYHAYSRLSHHGKSTAILFGMPSIMRSILQMYKAKKVVVCWDGNKHPKRIELLPEYKGHREEKRDPKQRKRFFKDIAKTRKLLHALGVTQLHNEDVEGDDMIYFATNHYSKLYKVLVVSGDKDMYQLINFDVSVYNPRSKQVHAPFAFSTIGVEIHQWVDYLCLVGDTSDDIPGYRGIGPVRACQFLRQFGSIKNYLADEDLEFSGVNDKDELRKIYKRNRRLIDLKLFTKKYYPEPHSKLLTYYKGKSAPEPNKELYYQMCAMYNLKTLTSDNFQKHFQL